MFVTEVMLEDAARRYGQPEVADFSFDVSIEEYNRIKASQKHGRCHDVTFYIFKGEKIVVIAKPFYPPGMYRAPSGGLAVGESITDGMLREAREETGCEIKIERFLLKTNVFFECPAIEDKIKWHSFVFTAAYQSGNFEFTDKREIREVYLANLSEFDSFAGIMRKTQLGGLHYRAALHEAVAKIL